MRGLTGAGTRSTVRTAGARGGCLKLPATISLTLRSYELLEHCAAHERILETLTTPGSVEGGNEMPVDLLED